MNVHVGIVQSMVGIESPQTGIRVSTVPQLAGAKQMTTAGLAHLLQLLHLQTLQITIVIFEIVSSPSLCNSFSQQKY